MAVDISITSILNQWDSYGVFSYVIPFLIIFAVVFGVLQKSKIFGTDNDSAKGINAILGIAVALASLQFDFVSTFFATIFPRFGVGIGIMIVVLIFMGLFMESGGDMSKYKWIGITLFIIVVVWAVSSWNFWGDSIGVSYWIQEYFWTIILLVGIGFLIKVIVNPEKKSGTSKSS